jgi:hypothetical protein
MIYVQKSLQPLVTGAGTNFIPPVGGTGTNFIPKFFGTGIIPKKTLQVSIDYQ